MSDKHITDQPDPQKGYGVTDESKPSTDAVTGVTPGGKIAPTAGADRPGTNEIVLFLASFCTLIAAGIGFAVRGDILGKWAAQFGFTQGELGAITGGGLTGFGISIIVLSFVVDKIGYGKLMILAFLLHTSSAIVTFFASFAFAQYGKPGAFMCLNIGMWLFALGNGTCEAVINPLTATMFRKNKTHWLNILHAGWPLGLVLGAMVGLAFNTFAAGASWEYRLAVFLVPTLLYGVMMVGRRFPKSEVSQSGVSMATMLLTLVSPILIFLFLLHALIGYVELGTDSWIVDITKMVLQDANFALLAFIWTNVLMFTLRFFAGPIVHQISPLGLLFFSAILGTAGLVLLGMPMTNTAWLWLAAVTVYGIGKTFYWPTMLGVISERYPKAGALALGLSAGIGMISAGLLGGPGIGYAQDYFAVQSLGTNSGTFERYRAENVKRDDKGNAVRHENGNPVMVYDPPRGFPFAGDLFPKVSGLGGDKVATLLGDPGGNNGMGKILERDIKNFTSIPGNTLEMNPDLQALKIWWDSDAVRDHRSSDVQPLETARQFGGKMALLWTAVVPAAMAVGFLLLLLYFKLRGGYVAEVLAGHKARDEEFLGGTEGPGEG
jgi:MFS family permease